MFHILYKYLILHNQLSIPGIGVFVLEREPAKVDMIHKAIHPPLPVVKFRLQNAAADRNLYDFIASEMNIAVVDAIRLFQDFSFNLKNDIQSKKWVELPEIGILTQGVRDEIKFKSAGVLKEYFPAVSADKISFAEPEPTSTSTPATTSSVVYPPEEKVSIYEEEQKKPREWWWLWALILALIAGGAIFYYYYYMMPQQ